MKKTLIILLFASIQITILAQNKLSQKLTKDMENQPEQWQDILVVGSERIDGYAFSEMYRSQYENRKEFTKAFLTELQKNTIQEDLWLNDLRNQNFEFAIIHQFWSVNIVAISASPKAIHYLENLSEIYWMEEISERPIEWVKPVKMEVNYSKSPNGKEQGIVAVKGDSLWKLGYSGRGSKLLTFDTGVWPNHPSFRDQFLGFHVPLHEAWYGYDTYFPGDKSNSHGTHVTGTCLGLDPATSDTIGLAFNAYFMATDPIVQSLADIKSATDILRAYEWAMNPDGDVSTTDDMPDVINNSWGRPFGSDDSVACDGWVNDLFINVEVAGIVSIHSAGNEGPNAATIGYPAVSNASVVNNFSIGAVNGNVTSYPIASFSSRGPTVCGDTGTLLIKPEIVAPGVNVRSSIKDANGNFTFANFNGTSMASPHVSGVSLLLREAFPNATATEIKEALFYTAIDLGDIGEDNTYGNGMIDGMGAFSYLSGLYTPFLPSSNTFDIHVSDFNIDPFSSYCSVNEIKAYMDNSKVVNKNQVSFTYGIEGIWSSNYNSSTGVYEVNDSVLLGFPSNVFLNSGWYTFYVNVDYNGSLQEIDTINNTRYITFWVNGNTDLPYLENFDSTFVFESSMFVGNPDQSTTWDTAVVQGKTRVSNSAVMQLGRYSPRKYQHDYLQTPNFSITPHSKLTFSFDLSYQLKFNGFADSLIVYVSTDCGQTWDTPVYEKGPDDLKTTTKPLNGNWVPQDSSDWRTEMVDLSAYKNESQIMVRLETSNGQGNHLYVDNINLFYDNNPVSVMKLWKPELIIYPNPTHKGTVHFSRPISGKLFSISGEEVMKFDKQNQLNVESLESGMYLLRVSNSGQVHKLIIH